MYIVCWKTTRITVTMSDDLSVDVAINNNTKYPICWKLISYCRALRLLTGYLTSIVKLKSSTNYFL